MIAFELADHGSCLDIVQTPAGDFGWHVTCQPLLTNLLSGSQLSAKRPSTSHSSRYYRSNDVAPLILLSQADRSQHLAARRTLRSIYGDRQHSHLRRLVQSVIDNAIADIVARGRNEFDFHRDFARPVPIAVMARLFGSTLDAARLDRLVWAAERARGAAAAEDAASELRTYMRQELTLRRERPNNDLLSEIGTLLDDGNAAPTEEALSVAGNVLRAGTLALTPIMDHGFIMLLQRPSAVRLLEGSELAADRVVHEICRYELFDPEKASSRPRGILRYATSTIRVADAQIEAGDLVILDQRRANFDPQVFDSPGKFDPERDAHIHRAFGWGARACPGRQLAVLELRLLFSALFRTFHGMRLSVNTTQLLDIARKGSGVLGQLPVKFESVDSRPGSVSTV